MHEPRHPPLVVSSHICVHMKAQKPSGALQYYRCRLGQLHVLLLSLLKGSTPAEKSTLSLNLDSGSCGENVLSS